jgi:hypothetical protein
MRGGFLKKLRKKLRKPSVQELLDSFLSNEKPHKQALKYEPTDTQLYHEVLRQDAMRQYRKITTEINDERKRISPQKLVASFTKETNEPIVSEKLSPVKSCQNCYYCVDSKRLGSIVWCKCSNALRIAEAGVGIWISSKINLDCWVAKD